VKKTPDDRFTYLEAGAPDAPALVFLHGIGGRAEAWRGQVERFGATCRSLAWDMPGYGGSAPLGQVSIAWLAEALAEFLRQTSVERPILVGHSIGGMIVQAYLAGRPAETAAAVLAQTSAAFGRPGGEWQRQFIAARLGPLDAGKTMASLAAGIVQELVGEGPNPEGVEVARASMAAVPEASYRAMMHALLGFDGREALGRIRVPVLVLAGSRDTNAPAPMMSRMAERIPGASFVCIEGAGHLANLERPAAFDTALRRFLAERVFAREGAMP
jgi:3-oxoadipate enol-lactonase